MKRAAFKLFSTFLVLWMTGCATKEEVKEIVTPDRLYQKALIYTRQNQIIQSFETKAAVTATWLNRLFEDRYNQEDKLYYFIGIISDVPLEQLPAKAVALNGKEPLTLRRVSRHDPLYRTMPSVNRWGRYYLAVFADDHSKEKRLRVTVDPYGKVFLNF